MSFCPSTFAVIGSDGAMGCSIQQLLPAHMKCIDTKHFQEHAARYTRRSARAAMREQYRQGVVWVSLPLDQFEDASQKPGSRSQLAHLFGCPGTGQRNTLLVHFSSIQKIAAEVLDHHSGPVLGLHQLHRPGVTDLGNQTAIITVTPTKKCHHLYAAAHAWLQQAVQEIGYGEVFNMDVDAHDQLMANIQFLRHTMVLVATEAIRQMLGQGHSDIQLKDHPEFLWLVQRILSGKCHVYANIAKENKYNDAIFRNWNQAVMGTQCRGVTQFIEDYFSSCRCVVSDHFDESGVNGLHREKITTPFSRVSDQLMDRCAGISIQKEDADSGEATALTSALEMYEKALSGWYEKFFSELQAFWMPLLKSLEFDPGRLTP